MLWTGQSLEPPRKGMGAIACAVASEDISMLKAMAKAPWGKMWDRTDRTSNFLVGLLTSILTGSSPMTWEKWWRTSHLFNAWGRRAFGDNLQGNTWGTWTAKSLVLHNMNNMWSVLINHHYSTTIMNSAHRSGIEGRNPRHLQRQALSFWRQVLQKCCVIDSDEPYYSPHLRETTENGR